MNIKYDEWILKLKIFTNESIINGNSTGYNIHGFK